MDRAAHHAAKAQLVAQMEAGQSWQAAAASVGLQTSRATAYRLLRRVRTEGAVALDDQRHGHPTKVRQGVADWLAAFCRAAPTSTGRTIQAALLERFGLAISVRENQSPPRGPGCQPPGSGRGGKISRTNRHLIQSGMRELQACSCSLPHRKQASSPPWSKRSLSTSRWLLGWRMPPQRPAASPS